MTTLSYFDYCLDTSLLHNNAYSLRFLLRIAILGLDGRAFLHADDRSLFLFTLAFLVNTLALLIFTATVLSPHFAQLLFCHSATPRREMHTKLHSGRRLLGFTTRCAKATTFHLFFLILLAIIIFFYGGIKYLVATRHGAIYLALAKPPSLPDFYRTDAASKRRLIDFDAAAQYARN